MILIALTDFTIFFNILHIFFLHGFFTRFFFIIFYTPKQTCYGTAVDPFVQKKFCGAVCRETGSLKEETTPETGQKNLC